MISDAEILATADPELMLDKRLQLAHDRMLLCTMEPETEEYRNIWQEYLHAGGDRTIRDKGIDLENWHRHRNEQITIRRG